MRYRVRVLVVRWTSVLEENLVTSRNDRELMLSRRVHKPVAEKAFLELC